MVGVKRKTRERIRIEEMLAKRRLLNKPQKERIDLALKEIKDYVELYDSIEMWKVNEIVIRYCVKVSLIEPKLIKLYAIKDNVLLPKNKQFKHCCYRFLDKYGNLLYIGRAEDVRDRMKSHKHLGEECYQQISKIQFVSFDNEDDLDIAERYYISKLQPIYNKEFKNKHFSFNLEELDKKQWITWEQGLKLIHRG